MNRSLGHLPEVWKQNIEKLKKSKSYREGREAAKRGEERIKNPYILLDDVIELLKKRNKWERGWEDVAYSVEMNRKRRKENHKERKAQKESRKHKHKHKHHDRHN
jgi:hypothetical protein